MRFGACCGLKEAEILKNLGYDYFEYLFSDLGLMQEEEYKEFARGVEKLGFYPEAMRVMLLGEMRVVGEEVSHAALRPYLETAFARAAAVGAQCVVFGSNKARHAPDGFCRAKAFDQLVDFTRYAGEIAGRHNITLVVEPLSFTACNMINLVWEGRYVAERAALPNVRCLADYHHMQCNRERPEAVLACAGWLAHCHIGTIDSAYPSKNDGHDYTPFFRALRTIGYDGRVSIEAHTKRPYEEEAADALELFRGLLQNL